MNRHEDDNRIDLISMAGNFLKTVRKFWILLVACTGLCAAAFLFWGSVRYNPVYQSQATFSVNTSESGLVKSGSSSLDQVKESLPYILQSDVMKNMVIDELGLSGFPAAIYLESKETLNLFTLTVQAGSPQLADQILQSVLDNCAQASVYVLGKIRVETLDMTVAARLRNGSGRLGSLLKGIAVGLVIFLTFSLIYTLTSHTIRQEEDFKKYLSVSCIGTVPFIRFKKRRKKFDHHIHIYNDKVGYGFSDAVRTLRMRVERETDRQEGKVILVTSSIPGEGKSTLAANLALSFAEKKKKILLVDLDLRNPSIGRVLGLEHLEKTGIADVLKKKKSVWDVISFIDRWNLYILFGGEAQSDPTRYFSSGEVDRLIDELKEQYDYVILDTSPAAMLADASNIAKCADCAVYVVKQDYVRIERIAEGMDALTLAQIPIVGAVLNGFEKAIGNYGSYRYARYDNYGHYGSYGTYGARMREEDLEYVEVDGPKARK